MKYNNKMTTNTLFKNEQLQNIVPQFPDHMPLQNLYSNAEIRRRVKEYLIGALGGQDTNDNITVEGDPNQILAQVQSLKTLMEQFFNSMPSLVKNLRRDTKLYTRYSNIGQLRNIKKVEQKTALMQDIVDNINFNPEWASENRLTKYSRQEFARKQQEWANKVGYQWNI